MSIADALREAAAAFIGPLSDEQRARISMPFEAAGERQRWFYTPTNHGGLLMSAMDPRQHQLACALIAAGLSEGGYNTAMAVMALESILDHVEHWPGRPHRRARDPLRYAFTVFGDPADGTWGWRVGGHHLSLHFTIVGDEVAATPCFMGADPSTAPLLGDDVYAPLHSAEALARELVIGLTDHQCATAVLAPHAPWDLVVGNRSQPEPGARPRKNYEIFRDDPDVLRPIVGGQQRDIEARLGVDESDLEALQYSDEPKGVAVSDLSADQQARVSQLVGHYIGRLDDELATPMLDANPVSSLYFAWSGSVRPGEPHYYRVHGPGLLLEYVNAQNDAAHIHAVLRDPRGDFGVRLLARN
jgi:hypothetical protein